MIEKPQMPSRKHRLHFVIGRYFKTQTECIRRVPYGILRIRTDLYRVYRYCNKFFWKYIRLYMYFP